ncbi:interleukin-6 receptor subunit alpha [Mantella aurantiaca]
MGDDSKHRYSYLIITIYSALLLTVASSNCPKPALSENTQVVALRSDADVTCPGCHGQTWWRRHNRTTTLQNGSRLSLASVSYEDEDNYTCYRDDGAAACTLQLLVGDDLEKPEIACYIRHPTHNITCDWQTTRELRPGARVTLIAWMVNGKHRENGCAYVPASRKFSCSAPYMEGDSGRHVLSLCVIGRTGRQTSNLVDSSVEKLVQPEPPINVTVTSLEDHPRRLRVSWSPPEPWLNDFYKLEYQVQYRVEGSTHASNGTTEEKHFTINDALARRRHVIRVRAKEEFFLTWSAWSEEAAGTPWSAGADETPATTEFQGFIVTSAEEEEIVDKEDTPPGPAPRYAWIAAAVSFVIVLLLFLWILMRNREVKLLKLKGGLLRALFQPLRSPAPLAPPLLMAPPEAVAVTAPQPRDAD